MAAAPSEATFAISWSTIILTSSSNVVVFGFQPNFAFAFALELDVAETKDFIGRAGFALSHSSKFDVIVEYFLVNRNYNVFELNEVLFAFDQPLIGA
mgnify:CR=1 FL=1